MDTEISEDRKQSTEQGWGALGLASALGHSHLDPQASPASLTAKPLSSLSCRAVGVH